MLTVSKAEESKDRTFETVFVTALRRQPAEGAKKRTTPTNVVAAYAPHFRAPRPRARPGTVGRIPYPEGVE